MFQIFRPIPGKLAKQQLPDSWAERRKHPRHRFIRQINICPANGLEFSATSFEISESGISAATPNFLAIGSTVQMFPVSGAWVKAIVRRKVGAMYGFEFIDLTEDQISVLHQLCSGLPLFQSTSDI